MSSEPSLADNDGHRVGPREPRNNLVREHGPLRYPQRNTNGENCHMQGEDCVEHSDSGAPHVAEVVKPVDLQRLRHRRWRGTGNMPAVEKSRSHHK